jgi:molybdopterin-guanine dinucleotide biosynthesis protein A
MGSDKALLQCFGETMLQRVLTTAREACHQVLICGSRELYADFGETLEDVEPGHGPMSGIHVALRATRTPLSLILSVDMPLMQSRFLEWLLRQARLGEQRITATEALGEVQPLCAVYRREVLPSVDEAMAQREYKLTGLFERVPTRVIPEHEIRLAGFDPVIFTNVNTPEEYEAVLSSRSMPGAGGT